MSRIVHPIEQESFRRLRAAAGHLALSHFPPLTRAVVERVIHSAADLEYASDLVIDEDALEPAHAALHAGAPVVVDVEMVAAGITRRETVCRLRDAESGPGLTRSAPRGPAGLRTGRPGRPVGDRLRADRAGGAAALDAAPALVIGLPVGFVGAAESKAALRASGLPPSATCPRRAVRRSPPPRSTPCCTTPPLATAEDPPVKEHRDHPAARPAHRRPRHPGRGRSRGVPRLRHGAGPPPSRPARRGRLHRAVAAAAGRRGRRARGAGGAPVRRGAADAGVRRARQGRHPGGAGPREGAAPGDLVHATAARWARTRRC